MKGYWADFSPFMRLAGEAVDASRERLETWHATLVRVREVGSWGDNIRWEAPQWLLRDRHGRVGLFDPHVVAREGVPLPGEVAVAWAPLVWRLEWRKSALVEHGAWKTDYRSDGGMVVTVPGRQAVAVFRRERYGVRYFPDGRTERLPFDDAAVVAVLDDVAMRRARDPHREAKRRVYGR